MAISRTSTVRAAKLLRSCYSLRFPPVWLVQSLRPLHNPTGLGPADLIGLTWTALLILVLLIVAGAEPAVRLFARHTRWCMLALALLPIALRLAMLPQAPVPSPRTPDDFSFALLGDTLAHFRLANPPHPMHRFFETNFVLQEPTYSSIYPPGQAIPLHGTYLGPADAFTHMEVNINVVSVDEAPESMKAEV